MQPESEDADQSGVRLGWSLPDTSLAPVAARQALGVAWHRWGFSVGDMTPRLLITELVTNALRHSFPPLRLALTMQPAGTVLFEVSDASPVPPTPRRPAEDATGGWGLVLLEALADDWGYRLTTGGKIVWFLLTPEPVTAH